MAKGYSLVTLITWLIYTVGRHLLNLVLAKLVADPQESSKAVLPYGLCSVLLLFMRKGSSAVFFRRQSEISGRGSVMGPVNLLAHRFLKKVGKLSCCHLHLTEIWLPSDLTASRCGLPIHILIEKGCGIHLIPCTEMLFSSSM